MGLAHFLHLPWNRRRLLADAKRLGRWGEKRCQRYLTRRGFRTLARNFACKTGEIDLVMADPDGSVVFVEVRTRRDEQVAQAQETVTAGKRARLWRTAKYFLALHRIENRPCRFDVVTIILGRSGPVQIRHYKNAFVL
jgi:putative endonuclease